MGSAQDLTPTFYGHIASTQDALLLFEACLQGVVNHVARRPHDRERAGLINSGNVFIYEEHSSGIKRWTDGVPWSPSRILGNFLIYRELERPFPPGEKKRAMKKPKRSLGGIGKSQEAYGRSPNAGSGSYGTADANIDGLDPMAKETERQLIGSLVDSYGFKKDGLIKKTVSVTVAGISHHLVSYYNVKDVVAGNLITPTKEPKFQNLTPRPDLITKQNFRTPVEEADSMERPEDRQMYGIYPYGTGSYAFTSQNVSQRPMSLPTPTMVYGAPPNLYHSYSMGHNPYNHDLPPHTTSSSYGHHYAPVSHIPFNHKIDPDITAYRPPPPRYYPNSVGINTEVRPHVHPPVSEPHRASTFDTNNTTESTMSSLSSGSMETKVTSDSGYGTQGIWNSDTGRRDSNNSSQMHIQRALPTPATQPPYDRGIIHPLSAVEHTERESMWPSGHSIGNVSVGPGHYMPPPWATTSPS